MNNLKKNSKEAFMTLKNTVEKIKTANSAFKERFELLDLLSELQSMKKCIMLHLMYIFFSN